MKVGIHPVALGFNDCYLIRDKEVIMIDGGTPHRINTFKKAIQNISIEPSDVKLVIVTHGHIDHIGSLNDIKKLTGASVVAHELEKECLERGEWIETLKPKGIGGWRWMWDNVGLPLVMSFYSRAPPTDVDLVVEDAGLSLVNYGVNGRVVYTPGHTMGSISVLLDSGEVFVGDLAMNKFPLRRTPGLPVLGWNLEKVKESWRRLIDLGAEIVYPGHGKSFPIDVIKKAISRNFRDDMPSRI